jgi:hypothetical protein
VHADGIDGNVSNANGFSCRYSGGKEGRFTTTTRYAAIRSPRTKYR